MKKHKKFGDSDFLPTFALANENHAEIAQLVERNLAKVEVAGPSPVFRSRGGPERDPDRKQKALYITDIQDFLLVFFTPVDAKGNKYFTP